LATLSSKRNAKQNSILSLEFRTDTGAAWGRVFYVLPPKFMSRAKQSGFIRVEIPEGAFQVVEVSPETIAEIEANGPMNQWDHLWCKCEQSDVPVDFRDDFECDCGVDKHHYHCTICGGIWQIG
jgi:hypothetical protein